MILVTGAKGQLGSDVCDILKKEGRDYLGVDIDTIDITDKNAVNKLFDENDFKAVIHCAAYTAVDKAEDDYITCFEANCTGTINIAQCVREKDLKIIYISTDYVFDGEGSEPFETDRLPDPINTYGRSKLMGEAAARGCKKHFIVRTSWVFGEKNTNFINTMLKLSETRDFVKVVCDQIGSPTYSKHLARLLCEMIETEKYGYYHATNDGFCSWYEFCKKAYELCNIKTDVLPVTSEEFPTKAKRPLNSRLSKKSLTENGFSLLPLWEDALKEYLTNIKRI